MRNGPDNPDCPVCSPPAVAERRYNDTRRFLAGGIAWWRFLGREHADVDLVRAFIKKLRNKLGDNPRAPRWIFNQRGVGYRMPSPTGS